MSAFQFDDSLGDILHEEKLCREIKTQISEGFQDLASVRGNLFLVRDILRALKRKEHELKRDLDQSAMCVSIYESIFSDVTRPAEHAMLVQAS
jgi:hypothetical protein